MKSDARVEEMQGQMRERQRKDSATNLYVVSDESESANRLEAAKELGVSTRQVLRLFEKFEPGGIYNISLGSKRAHWRFSRNAIKRLKQRLAYNACGSTRARRKPK